MGSSKVHKGAAGVSWGLNALHRGLKGGS